MSWERQNPRGGSVDIGALRSDAYDAARRGRVTIHSELAQSRRFLMTQNRSEGIRFNPPRIQSTPIEIKRSIMLLKVRD